MTLFAHQVDALKKSQDKNTFAYLMDMGTGKSLVSIIKTQSALPCLIITKNGPLKYNWVDEIKKWSDNKKVCLLDGSSQDKRNLLEGGGEYGWYVCNYESIRLIRLELEKLNIKSIILDESTSIKNPKAKQSKAILKLGMLAQNRYLLTGTAVIQSPLDLYNQFYFLDPKILGFESFWAYKNFYCIMEPRKFGTLHFKEVVGYQNLEVLRKRIEPYSFIIKKEDCLDLPPKIYQSLYCDMSSEMSKIYNDLKEKLVAEFLGKDIVVNTVLTKMIRLQQLLGGQVIYDDGTKSPIESPKMKALLDLIESLEGQRLIVWSRYVYEIQNIMANLSANKINCAAIFGEVPPEQRQNNIDSFKRGEVQVLVCQQATAGYGINLVEAKYACYYSNDYSLEHRQQSEDRIYRIGQTEKVTIYDLVVKGSIDEAILKILKQKKMWQDVILTDGDIETILNGGL
jgi:SNF2 family DNA or RNA helicase